MNTNEVLTDAFERIRDTVRRASAGLDTAGLAYRPDGDANSIGWLLWHLTRVQDHHISEIAGREQAWVDAGWAERFGMEPDRSNIGFGHTSDEVAALRPSGPDVLVGYNDAVTERTIHYLDGIDADADELERIIDRSWDPPVSVGVRIVSVINDCMQHAGQASYVRGLLDRLGEVGSSERH